LRLAERVADGESVDWGEEEQHLPDGENRDVLRGLRLLATMASSYTASENTDEPVEPLTERWGALRLVERVGRGALGEVYRAHDPRLGRDVALKLLTSRSTDGEALIEEGHLMSRVRHANVVTVYGAECHDGRIGIWMELVRGRTLAQQIDQQGPMAASEAARIGMEICRALAAVHQAGLVHRDVKAQNVMREQGGRIVLTDFGAGLDLDRSNPDRFSGTPLYMAPEILVGGKALPAADLYSVGVLLYYLVTGEYPYDARDLEDLRAAQAAGRMRLLRDARPDLPAEFIVTVERALSKNPADRFASAGAMERALQATALGAEHGATRRPVRLATRAILGGLVLTVTAAVVWWIAVGSGDPRPTLLVAPFEVRGQESGGEYLGLSVAEAIAVNLTPVPDARVLPVSRAPAGTEVLPVGRRHGARYAITGQIERRERNLSIRVQVIDVEGGDLVGGAARSGVDSELTALAAALTYEITSILELDDERAYDLVARSSAEGPMAESRELGEVLGAFRELDMPRLRASTERLVDAFPDSRDAHAFRVNAWILSAEDDPSPATLARLETALAALERVDPDSPYLSRGRAAAAHYRGRPAEAVAILDRVLDRSDLSPALRSWMLRSRSNSLVLLGQHERALRDAEQALRLDPVNPFVYTAMSLSLLNQGRYEDALEMGVRAVALEPRLSYPNRLVGSALVELSRLDEAIEAFSRACNGGGPMQEDCALQALTLGHTGRLAEAMTVARRAIGMPDTPTGAFALARLAGLSNDLEQAVEFLRRAVVAGLADVTVGTVPELVPLHGRPEFEEILADVEAAAHLYGGDAQSSSRSR
jgi:serine/threonine-protein kinase